MALHDDFSQLDATAQAALVRSGEVTASELVAAAVSAAERINPTINAIIHPRYEAALSEAADATGPFAGVPIVIKDLGCAMAGEPMHMGTRGLKSVGYRAGVDSALYRRFRAAGFVAIGRTNTPEWGSTITTEPLAYGPARNPWNTDHSTGGSSGGSAAAVAAGIVSVGHANDGGGSIRVPASECGLVGLKPTRGRVSQAPLLGEGWAGYTVDGCVTRTVRDTAAVLDAISGYEPGDPYAAPALPGPLVAELGASPGPLRIGFVDSSPNVPADADCSAAVARAVGLLESLGHHLEASSPAEFFDADMVSRFITVLAANSAADARTLEMLLARPIGEDDLEPDNHFYIAMGQSVSSADYIAAVTANHAWTRQLLSWWHPADGSQGYDLLVTPTLAGPPPPIGYLSGPEGVTRVTNLLQYTAQSNVTGQPAISLPLYVSAAGLPIGVQIIAGHGREDLLVRVAAALETSADWSSSRAPLTA